MWSDLRADAARRKLAALAGGSSGGIEEVQAAAIEIVRRVVPFDAACWATVDPDTMLFTGSTTVEFEPSSELERRFVAVEAAGRDPNTFRDLAARTRTAARLSDAGPAAVEASDRFQAIWSPLGVGYELRAAFTVGGRCWAVGGMLRAADAADFSDPEVQFVLDATPAIASSIRAALLRGPDAPAVDGEGPAVLVIDDAGAVRSATPAAAGLWRRSAQLGGPAGRLALAALGSALQHGASGARARLADPTEGWLVLEASALTGAAGAPREIAVTISRAAPRDVVGLVLAAHGVSTRERAVCDAVLAGLSTSEIAARLCISPNTVQDHLKSIFAKTGLRSRRELSAYLTR